MKVQWHALGQYFTCVVMKWIHKSVNKLPFCELFNDLN